MRALLIVLASAALGNAGCHMGLAGLVMGASVSDGPYEAGAIARSVGPASVRTLACLDVGLAISGLGADALLDMYVGNRCVHAEPFDLAQLVIRATDERGEERSVRLHDPRHELERAHVGALERGHERIRIGPLQDVARICFELAAVAPDAPDARPEQLCLERSFDQWQARPAG